MGSPVSDLFFAGRVRIEVLRVSDLDEPLTGQDTQRRSQPGRVSEGSGERRKRGLGVLLKRREDGLSSAPGGPPSKVRQHQRAEDAKG